MYNVGKKKKPQGGVPCGSLFPLLLGGGVRGGGFFLQPLDTGDEIRNRIILRETIAYILEHPKWSLSLQTHKMLGIK